jgi:hypothetical protein
VTAQTIYWTDIGTSKIQRLDLNAGVGTQDLLTMGQVSTPVDVVLEPASGKMYWTEGSPADFMISRANLDGSNVELLIEGLTSPSGIALAPQPLATPTLSQWGLVAVTLILLAVAIAVLLPRRNGRNHRMPPRSQ